MEPSSAVYWFLPLFVLQLALFYAFYRMSSLTDGGADRSESAVDRESGTVTCPDCGAENELGYTYCHGCIEELPNASSRSLSSATPRRRGIL